MDLILHVLLLGAVIFFLAEALPGIMVGGFGTALVVAIVYGLINVFLGTVLKIISFPFIFITLGVLLLFINTFLLWLTDQLVDDFKIDNLGTTFVAAAIISLSDSVLGWVF